MVSLLVILYSLKIFQSQGIKHRKKISLPILFAILYIFWYVFRLNFNINGIIIRLSTLIAFSCLLCWPLELTKQSYEFFKKVIIFFCIGSSVISILGAVGILDHLPHFILPPQSPLHQRRGIVYYVYGCFVINYDGSLFLPRACGFLQEPGHFSVLVGLVYIIERSLNRKRNPWILIGGLFTFSMNFAIMAFLAELFSISSFKAIMKTLKIVFLFFIGVFLVFSFLPKDIKEQVSFLLWERNLVEVFEAIQYSGSIEEGLDERTNDYGLWSFNHMSENEKMIGKGSLDDDDILSDYRGMIFSIGYVGLFLSACLMLSILAITGNRRQKLPLFGGLFLVLMHRSWMLVGNFYLYYIAFLAVVVYKLDSEIVVTETANIQKA